MTGLVAVIVGVLGELAITGRLTDAGGLVAPAAFFSTTERTTGPLEAAV